MTPAEREQMYQRYMQFNSLVKGGVVEAHWIADGSSFWYAEGAPDHTVIYKTDPRTGNKSSTTMPKFSLDVIAAVKAPPA